MNWIIHLLLDRANRYPEDKRRPEELSLTLLVGAQYICIVTINRLLMSLYFNDGSIDSGDIDVDATICHR